MMDVDALLDFEILRFRIMIYEPFHEISHLNKDAFIMGLIFWRLHFMGNILTF